LERPGSRLTVSKMALASVLGSDCADFAAFDGSNKRSLGLDFGRRGVAEEQELSFALRGAPGSVEQDDVEKKIEFLHGTTTLAFKVSTG